MEKNDIGFTVHRHIACMFEGLIIQDPAAEPDEPERKRGLFRRREEPTVEVDIEREARRWKVNEMPLKSLLHMVNQMQLNVEVYTYMDPIYIDVIERWIARKGASVTVWAYYDLNDLREDFKYNRDVHTFFTTDEGDAAVLGMRATVVNPDGTFGI